MLLEIIMSHKRDFLGIQSVQPSKSPLLCGLVTHPPIFTTYTSKLRCVLHQKDAYKQSVSKVLQVGFQLHSGHTDEGFKGRKAHGWVAKI